MLVIAIFAASGQSPQKPLRWSEGRPGCTFSADDDGKYRYGFWTDAFGVVLAVDALEVQKTSRRTEPIFAVQLTARSRGDRTLQVDPVGFTLEFVDHLHNVQPALDSAALRAKLQKDLDAFSAQTERTIQKHPDKQAGKKSELESYRRNIADMIEFIQNRSLRSATLDTANPEDSGWVFFRADSKWIGDWKKQERFVLRFPLAGKTIEFPFALPPSKGDVLLRRR